VPRALAAGNADAAHACQHGGYANLVGITSAGQTILFNNEGDCVSFAAQGGTFTTPISPCLVTATSGCLTFNGATLPAFDGSGDSVTLTGATTFDDTCSSACEVGATAGFPNSLATGGGDYVETDSGGHVISQGIYRIADTPSSQEGLFQTDFGGSACTTATYREVIVAATTIDRNTGASQSMVIGVVAEPTGSTGYFGPSLTATFVGPVPSNSITC
jgi:hypothetical protein